MQINRCVLSLCCFALTFAAIAPTRADRPPEPLWEVGAGLGALAFPTWAGSRQHDLFLSPVPYVIYRGEHIQADRSGIRGMLFDTKTFDIRLSLAGSPPPDDDDAMREGMPGLDPVLEIGPELRWGAWERKDKNLALYLRLPLRAAVTASGQGLDTAGWFSSPAINLESREWPTAGWRIGINAGPVLGDRDYHAYFYEVAPQYATSTRPAWEAHSGYGGLQWTTSASRRMGNLWVGAFLRVQYLQGATFEDSPLVRTDDSLAVGVAVAWVFARSKTLVKSRDED